MAVKNQARPAEVAAKGAMVRRALPSIVIVVLELRVVVRDDGSGVVGCVEVE